MKWNWQRRDWPNFTYKTADIAKFEANLLYRLGLIVGAHKHLNDVDLETLKIELIANEAFSTSDIEGEIVNLDNLKSSIRRNLGLNTDHRKIRANEQGIADLMIDLYHNFSGKLTHDILFKWHKMLMNGRYDFTDLGKYRTKYDPRQIISGNYDNPKILFEAPSAEIVTQEMTQFIKWFNDSAPNSNNPTKPLIRAAIAHLYFSSIHPFADGNGRIARALSVKALSQSTQQPLLTAFSTIIQNNKQQYYDALAASNKKNEITQWIIYFAQTLLKSQNHTKISIEFLIAKTKIQQNLQNQLNSRQENVLNRIFAEGPKGFKDGLNADYYIKAAHTSRPTATRDLQDLVNKKALIKTGMLKGTRYQLNNK